VSSIEEDPQLEAVPHIPLPFKEVTATC
jgi:hypothetical protein